MEPKYYAFLEGDWTPLSSAEKKTGCLQKLHFFKKNHHHPKKSEVLPIFVTLQKFRLKISPVLGTAIGKL